MEEKETGLHRANAGQALTLSERLNPSRKAYTLVEIRLLFGCSLGCCYLTCDLLYKCDFLLYRWLYRCDSVRDL
ncbi:hypothetical protein J6590_089276 [Homalodisca vitripennis]|nr:hypothetical protein J6590_089276 [Homalodisca vitripennis]